MMIQKELGLPKPYIKSMRLPRRKSRVCDFQNHEEMVGLVDYLVIRVPAP